MSLENYLKLKSLRADFFRGLSYLTPIISLAVFTGCASHPSEKMSMPMSADPSQEISQLEKDLDQAKSDQYSLLVPEHFKKAQQSLEQAESRRSKGDSNVDILDKVAEGRTFLNQAKQLAGISHEALGSVQVARDAAIKTDAHQFFPKEFSKADANFKDIANDVEKGDTRSAQKNREKLIANYQDLELKGARESYLGGPRRIIETAKKEDAKKWAPKSLKQAQGLLEQTDHLIEKNPSNQAQIQPMADETKKQALLLLSVTRKSKQIDQGDSEQVALGQVSQSSQMMKMNQIAAEREQTLAELKSQAGMGEKIKQARASFTPEEADVFNSGNEVIIRLKNLKFPSAKSSIPSSNFGTLNKVANVLKEFDGKPVTIEGHTDSKGSQRINQRLSAKRASAVKDYLIANQAVKEEKVEVQGKGFSQPIASNKTAQGRAMNRRVDIVISNIG